MRSRITALGIAAALLLTGCSADPLAEQYRSGDSKNYISGDGTITEVPADERLDPVRFGGETEDGAQYSSDDALGEVLVVNFWYAGCAPCRTEAPDLQALSAQYEGNGASFVGVNIYDEAETAQAFARNFDISYPSILDVRDAAVRQAFAGEISPNAVPVTMVLDKEGRIAARIVGQIPERSILDTIVSELTQES